MCASSAAPHSCCPWLGCLSAEMRQLGALTVLDHIVGWHDQVDEVESRLAGMQWQVGVQLCNAAAAMLCALPDAHSARLLPALAWHVCLLVWGLSLSTRNGACNKDPPAHLTPSAALVSSRAGAACQFCRPARGRCPAGWHGRSPGLACSHTARAAGTSWATWQPSPTSPWRCTLPPDWSRRRLCSFSPPGCW